MFGYRVKFQDVNEVSFERFKVREPKRNEVVVKVYYSLISSGTEKAYLTGQPNTDHRFPTVPGYSSVGIVVEKGNDIKEVTIGDRVFVSYAGHASYNIKDIHHIVKIPENVDFEKAVFTRLASFPLLALRRARVEMGESIVVIGLGMLGLFGVQLAKIAGGLPVIAVGNREIRRKKAIECGADYVYSPDDADLKDKIIRNTQITGQGGADVVLETSGNIEGLLSGLSYTARLGRVLVNGCNRITDKPIDLYQDIHRKGVILIGAHDLTRNAWNSCPGNWTAKRDYKTLLGYMSDGRLRPEIIHSKTVPAGESPKIYNALLNDRNFPLGVVLNWKGYWDE